MIRKVSVSVLSIVSLALCIAVAASFSGNAQTRKDKEKVRAEEADEYWKKWLKKDVVYIITSEEKAVFESLSTPDEKEQFIEQFWFRRNPDPTSAINEFKEEHYRRIAYANDHFGSGWPGWMTDRGRIYIIHGPPAEIETHAQGAPYQRPLYEGGGTTSTYAYETWRYRYIKGVGNDVVLEFVDPSFSGEYRLALNADEKDAFKIVAEQGLTLAEQLGRSRDEAAYLAGADGEVPYQMIPDKETAFARYERYTQVQQPQKLKYKDLERFVTVDISYEQLSIKLRKDYFRLDERRTLVPITLEVDNQNLTFVDRRGLRVAEVAVYGIVTNLSSRIVAEFEHNLITSLSAENFQQGVSGRSVYQKILLLESKGRYKLDLVIKDINSSNVGVVRQAIVPPPVKDDRLAVSSLILSDSVRKLEEIPQDRMFVLGDVWISPNLEHVFTTDSNVNVYFQLYGAGIDQSTLNPSVAVSYRILGREGQPILEVEEDSGESIHSFSDHRVIFIKEFSLDQLSPGKYSLKMSVRDRISNQSISLTDRFEVVGL
ncbi:GWxTD domain-containing protein [Acidobacteria bacterium AH-259-O06]|nr:GWxTD domain-containing protein [Acidobacteria bacterium AH-259-O06]